MRIACGTVLAVAANAALAATDMPAVGRLADGAAISVDGRLDESAWAAAEWNGPFVRLANSVKDRTVRAQTGTTGVSPVAMKRTRPFRAVKFNTAE
ncbi:MAG: hypothetical protein IJG13_15350 [Kiritimatiellae bacterium]|nr:hypothetical protein [Kiritimatiellia bacterium]